MHRGAERVLRFDVVVDAHVLLPGALSVQAPCVLDNAATVGNRQGEKQRVQTWQIETFPDQCGSCEKDEAFFSLGHRETHRLTGLARETLRICDT